MTRDDPALRAEFRGPGICEACERWVPVRECSHSMGRGQGSASQVDIRGNLTALCPTCHYCHHSSNEPSTEKLLDIAAKREGTTVEAIKAEVYRIRRCGKDGREPNRKPSWEAAS